MTAQSLDRNDSDDTADPAEEEGWDRWEDGRAPDVGDISVNQMLLLSTTLAGILPSGSEGMLLPADPGTSLGMPRPWDIPAALNRGPGVELLRRLLQEGCEETPVPTALFAAVTHPPAQVDVEVGQVCMAEAMLQAKQVSEGMLSEFDSWIVGRREEGDFGL